MIFKTGFVLLGITCLCIVVYICRWLYLHRNRFKVGDPIEWTSWTWSTYNQNRKGMILAISKKKYTVLVSNESYTLERKLFDLLDKEQANKKLMSQEYIVYDPKAQCNRSFKYTR